jgi:hypothetical protein
MSAVECEADVPGDPTCPQGCRVPPWLTIRRGRLILRKQSVYTEAEVSGALVKDFLDSGFILCAHGKTGCAPQSGTEGRHDRIPWGRLQLHGQKYV